MVATGLVPRALATEANETTANHISPNASCSPICVCLPPGRRDYKTNIKPKTPNSCHGDHKNYKSDKNYISDSSCSLFPKLSAKMGCAAVLFEVG